MDHITEVDNREGRMRALELLLSRQSVGMLEEPAPQGAELDLIPEQGIVTRHYGGEFECVHVSARTGQGIEDLLTTIVLASDILELKANPNRNAIGTIVDAHLERGRGPVATVLVQAGTLKVGDDFVCGHIYGRVRALSDAAAHFVEMNAALLVGFVKYSRGTQGQTWTRTDRPAGAA